MIEKAARALVKRNYPGASEADIDEMWQDYAEDARAMLLAIRDLDEEVLAAGVAVDIDLEWQASEQAVPTIWTAMIDKALEDGRGHS